MMRRQHLLQMLVVLCAVGAVHAQQPDAAQFAQPDPIRNQFVVLPGQAFHRDGPNDGAPRPAEPVRPDECDVGPGEMLRPRLLGSGSGVMLSAR